MKLDTVMKRIASLIEHKQSNTEVMHLCDVCAPIKSVMQCKYLNEQGETKSYKVLLSTHWIVAIIIIIIIRAKWAALLALNNKQTQRLGTLNWLAIESSNCNCNKRAMRKHTLGSSVCVFHNKRCGETNSAVSFTVPGVKCIILLDYHAYNHEGRKVCWGQSRLTAERVYFRSSIRLNTRDGRQSVDLCLSKIRVECAFLLLLSVQMIQKMFQSLTKAL